MAPDSFALGDSYFFKRMLKSIHERAMPDSHSTLAVCPLEECGLTVEYFPPSAQMEFAFRGFWEGYGRRADHLGECKKGFVPGRLSCRYSVPLEPGPESLNRSVSGKGFSALGRNVTQPGHQGCSLALPVQGTGLRRHLLYHVWLISVLPYLSSQFTPDFPRCL